MTDQHEVEETSGRSIAGLVVAGLIATGLGLFIVQNTDSTPVSWLWIDRSAPLWLVIFIASVAGAVLSEILGWRIRRSKRNR